MKANELMIDDWVYNKNIAKPMQIYPTIFSQMFRSNPNATTEDYNIFPIPLTPEILEKNGFEVTRNISSSRNKDVWSLHVSKYKIFYITEHHNKKKFPYFWIDIGSNSDIKYVHQLQHALRLCGIEKEIVV